MRLSVVFELLLVFLFLAFAAARVIDKKNAATAVQNAKKLRQGGPNRFCACTTNMCNCCRDFSLPVVPVKGPGCASIMYLKGDKMMISMSFGERVLSNMTIAGPKPKPVCMTLPGGISQFCGRVYGISRTEKNFKACLGLELRALDDIEAALRVSCFKFGPKGVNLESAPPIPPDESKEPEDEDDDDDDDYGLDDDDDDDLIGLGGDLDDDDDDDDDDGPNAVGSNEGNEVDSDSADYAGFSVLGEDFFGTFFGEETRPKKKKKEPIKKVSKPAAPLLKASTTTRRPILPIKRPTVRPLKITRKPVNRVTLIPRPSLNKVGTSAAPVATPELVYSQPPASIPPISHPIFSITSTAASLPASTHKYSTTEKLLTASPQPTTAASTTQAAIHSEKPSETIFAELTTEYPTKVTVSSDNDELKLPEVDVEKIEAIAAIAQQGFSSSVIHSSALPPKETDKIPLENEFDTKTETYVLVPEVPMLKAGAPQKESEEEEEEEEEEDDLLDGIIDDGLDSDDEETSGSEEDSKPQASQDSVAVAEPPKAQLNETSEDEKDQITPETEKPTKVKPPEKSEEEDEEESEDDFFDGIIDGEDDEEEEEDQKKKGDKQEDEVEEENVKEEEEEEEEDILGAFVADPYESENEKEETNQDEKDGESEEESEEEDDFLNVLGDDDEGHDNSAEEVEDENNKPSLKDKNGNVEYSTESRPTTDLPKLEEAITDSVTVSDKSDESNSSSSSSSSSEETGEEQRFNETITTVKVEEPQETNISTTETTHEETTVRIDTTEIGRFDKVDFVPLPKSDALLLMKAAAKMRDPQVVRLRDLIVPKKKYLPETDKPISTSRTHRRMNLDRWAPI